MNMTIEFETEREAQTFATYITSSTLMKVRVHTLEIVKLFDLTPGDFTIIAEYMNA